MTRRQFLRFAGAAVLTAPTLWPKVLRGPREGDEFRLYRKRYVLCRAAAPIRAHTVVQRAKGGVVPAHSHVDFVGVAEQDARLGEVFPVCVYGPCWVRTAPG